MMPALRTRWRRPLLFALLASAVMHLPLTPLVRLFGMLSRLADMRAAADADYDPSPVTISVELLEPTPPDPPAGDPVATAPERAPDAPPAAPPQPSPPERPDRADEPAPPGGALAEPEPDQPSAAFGLVTGKPNVTLEVWFSAMRAHPLAPELEALLRCGPLGRASTRAGADPLADFDGAVFAGPRLSDPASYTMALAHHLPEARVHGALAALVRGQGAFLAPSTVRLSFAGKSRVVFPLGPGLLFSMPETVWRSMHAIPARLSVPRSAGRALSLAFEEPDVPLARLGVHVPKTIERMRLDVYAPSREAVTIHLAFDDRDDAAALEDAPRLTEELRAALADFQGLASLARTLAPVVGLGADVDVELPSLELAPSGRKIEGRASVPQTDAARVLAKLVPFVCTWPAKPGPR